MPPQTITRAAWVALAAFVVQNIEESLFLPAWLARSSLHLMPVSPGAFRLATLALTLFGAALVGLALRRGDRSAWSGWALSLAAGALVANAITHLSLSLVTGTLMPGAVSGGLLQGPAAIWLLVCLVRHGWISPRAAVLSVLLGFPISAGLAAASLTATRHLVG